MRMYKVLEYGRSVSEWYVFSISNGIIDYQSPDYDGDTIYTEELESEEYTWFLNKDDAKRYLAFSLFAQLKMVLSDIKDLGYEYDEDKIRKYLTTSDNSVKLD